MKILKIFSVYFILQIICISYASRILILQCVAVHSYSNLIEAIAVTLASEHNVTFINRFKMSVTHPNITFIKLKESRVTFLPQFKNIYEIMMHQDDSSEQAINAMLSLSSELIDEIMTDPAVKYLFESRPLFDILIMPTAVSEAFIQFAHFLKIPLVQVAASFPLPWQNEAIGNPNFFSTDNSLLIHPTSNSFYGRLVKFVRSIQLIYRYNYKYIPAMNLISKKYFPSNTPNIEEISKNTSLLLVNTQEAMVFSKPTVPNYVEIGGLHLKVAKKLPEMFKSFLEGAESDGLVYMSLGSTLQTNLPSNLLNNIINVFRKLPQRVIIKTRQTIPNLPTNILTCKWCPQQDILGHRNTKLFITQGGMLSLQESVYHDVPVLVLPLSLDQPTNALLVNKLGYGRYLRLSQLTEDIFLKEIREILTNKRYIKKIKELSILTKDVQHNARENLKWWINFVIRHKGFVNSKSLYYQYYDWTCCVDADIFIFIVFVILLIFVILVLIIGLIKKHVYGFKKIKED